MKNLIKFAVVFTLSLGSIMAQTADEVVSKHIEARGGKEKLMAVKSVIMENTIGVQGMELNNKMSIVIGKAMKSETSVMGNDIIQAYKVLIDDE